MEGFTQFIVTALPIIVSVVTMLGSVKVFFDKCKDIAGVKKNEVEQISRNLIQAQRENSQLKDMFDRMQKQAEEEANLLRDEIGQLRGQVVAEVKSSEELAKTRKELAEIKKQLAELLRSK